MFQSIMKPVIRSFVKEAVSTSCCNNRWGNSRTQIYPYGEKSLSLNIFYRHRPITTPSSSAPASKTTSMSSNPIINVQYRKESMELEPEEANKSLYLCNVEYKGSEGPAYAIRNVKLSDLLSSSVPVPLRQVLYYAHPHLPESVGCGVFGDGIFIVGGFTSTCPTGSYWKRDVYKFDTNTNNDPSESMISKLNTNMHGGKQSALTVELCGKLYVLSTKMVDNSPPFEVFDPKLGTWEVLPHPPFFKTGSPYFRCLGLSCVVANTKIFIFCQEGHEMFIFDAAQPDKEWRIVSTMGGGPFLFSKTIALDLADDEDHDKKIMFEYTVHPWNLQVYVMSLCDNQETITKIGEVELPGLREQLGLTPYGEFFHIGGNKAALAITIIDRDGRRMSEYDYFSNNYSTRNGVVIPFQYEIDMSKGEKNGLTIQFRPLRFFKHHTNRSIPYYIFSAKCFLL